jgi:hypothetical protein
MQTATDFVQNSKNIHRLTRYNLIVSAIVNMMGKSRQIGKMGRNVS